MFFVRYLCCVYCVCALIFFYGCSSTFPTLISPNFLSSLSFFSIYILCFKGTSTERDYIIFIRNIFFPNFWFLLFLSFVYFQWMRNKIGNKEKISQQLVYSFLNCTLFLYIRFIFRFHIYSFRSFWCQTENRKYELKPFRIHFLL